MKLKQLFDVFSRRQPEKPSNQRKLFTNEFRSRIFMICRDRFSKYHSEFWMEIHNKFQYLLGRPRLSDSFESTQIEDLLQFLSQCRDNNFLDFIEYIFRSKHYWRGFPDVNELADIINDLLLIDDLPYAVTKFVQKERIEKRFVGNIEAQPERFIDTISYPKIICREDQITHSFTIEPTLKLLSDKRFETANQEFLDALEDYRKKDYGDCLTKCCSAFESTMKIICDLRGWSFDPTKDTASKLLNTIIQKSELESFFKEPLSIVATLRNRLSTSHGSGTQIRSVPKYKAKYTINATASAILLIVEECL